jgi:hypothetical protein
LVATIGFSQPLQAAPGQPAKVIHLAPSGGDDTAALQAALDAGTVTPNLTIRLAAGTFTIQPVYVEGFRGKILGAGKNATLIRAVLGSQPVVHPKVLFPSLLYFMDSDVAMEDMSVEVPEGASVESWDIPYFGYYGVRCYNDIIGGGGTTRGSASFRRMHFKSARVSDPATTPNLDGFSAYFGIMIVGWVRQYPGTGDWSFRFTDFSCDIVVDQCDFTELGGGIVAGQLTDSRVRFVNSTAWTMEDCFQGFDYVNSSVHIEGNRWRSTWWGPFLLVQNVFSTGRYGIDCVVVNNHITVENDAIWGTGSGMTYIDVWGRPDLAADGPNPVSRFHVLNNEFHMNGSTDIPAEPYSGAAISIRNRNQGVIVANNRISGASQMGVELEDCREAKVLANDFSDFNPVRADIVLSSTTCDSQVVAKPGDTVEDSGTNNKILPK